MPNDDFEMGDNNTIVGDINLHKLGSGNTIVNFSDANGNTIFRGGTSIGSGAGFHPTSTIIGAGAGANMGKREVKDTD